MASPKYKLGDTVWYIWTEDVWTTEPCVIVSIRSEDIGYGPDEMEHHYGVAFGGKSKADFDEDECRFHPTRKDAQSTCDMWNHETRRLAREAKCSQRTSRESHAG